LISKRRLDIGLPAAGLVVALIREVAAAPTPEAVFTSPSDQIIQKMLKTAPSIDKRCFSQFQAEQYSAAAKTCEKAAKGHDFNSFSLNASGNIAGSHREQYLAATLRMEAATSNWVENHDDLAYEQVGFAIDVFRRIASSKVDPADLVADAKSSLRDAQTELATMKAIR
jgi:hypothetical protein